MSYQDYTSLLDSQFKGTNFSPTWRLAIWEYSFDQKQDELKKIGKRKTNRLKYLLSLDLFSLPEERAISVQKQIGYLYEELNHTAGLLLHIENLQDAYLLTSAWLVDYYREKETAYRTKINGLEKQIENLSMLYQNATNGESETLNLLLSNLQNR